MNYPATALLALTLGAGCGGNGGGGGGSLDFPDAHLGSAADAQLWSGASAPGLFAIAYTPLVAAETAGENGSGSGSAACPVQTGSGSDITLTGGCTEDNGDMWTGTARQIASGITYANFGVVGAGSDSTFSFNGTLGITPNATDTGGNFDIDVTFTTSNATAGMPAGSGAISYSGTIADSGSGSDEITTWNGAGEYGTSAAGKVSSSTANEALNSDQCQYTALSGTTTIDAGGSTIVITYEGATSCGSNAAAQWSLDGVAQGEIDGISCSTGSAPGAGVALGIALVGFARRRRRS